MVKLLDWTSPCLFSVFIVLALADTLGSQGSAWTVLFDGTSTAAWRGYRQQEFPSQSWKIEEGTLKTVVGTPRVDIITRQPYENFELELEWKVSPEGNSGIFYRVTEDSEQIWHSGPEVQILDDERHRDGKDPKTSAGALYALKAPHHKVLRPVGEFNQVRLIVRGNQVEHWLNGAKILEYDLESDELKAQIANSKFAPYPQFAKARRGHIGLQHHGQEVWFRNVRIRELE